MIITLENIQGFVGSYTYEINDLITIINSKHNGVGKTTLFDCLRFLCDENLVDKDEREFFLNLESTSGLFSVKVADVTHGFAFMQNQPPLFFRIIDGEELERSDTNFPNVGADIGILQINSTIFNIFSKEVNLFSGSNVRDNYQLIKAITTHEKTEEALELMTRSEEIAKQKLNHMRAEKKIMDSQVQNLSYYSNVVEMEEMLNNRFYVEFEDMLEQTLRLLSSLHETVDINVDSAILEYFSTINESVHQLVPIDDFTLNLEPLEKLEEVIANIDSLNVLDELVLPVEPLEQLEKTLALIDALTPTQEVESIDLTPLHKLEELINILDSFQDVVELEVSVTTLNKVSEVCVSLAQMLTQLNQIEYHDNQLSKLRSSISATRVMCPIREEVYLIDGKCNY